VLDGRYQLKEILGSGGMATVWRAHDRILHRTVALKILDQSAATDHALGHRMLDEALAAAAITHPHLVDVYDYGETSGPAGEPLPFVVMEYLTGRTLADPGVLRSLSPGEAITICGQVAGALAALHQHGLVHRDIKPANVMLTPDGAKVIDFGIAALAGTTNTDEHGTVVGTPSHLAPERLLGGDVSPAADVYALGVLTYWLLAHQQPWPTRGAAETLRAHLTLDPPPLPPIDGVPPHVADSCLRCLAKNPDARPSAAQVAWAMTADPPQSAVERDIASWRSSRQTIAAEEAQVARQRRRRRTVLAVSAVSAGCVALIALIVSLPAIGGPGRAANGTTAPASALDPFGTDATESASPSSATQTSVTTSADPPAGNPTTTVTSGAGPAPVDHTISAEGGTVRVRCQGNAATLLIAEPKPGFDISDSTNRPTQIQVVFSSATHESDVRARCSPQGLVPNVKETGG